MLSSLLVVVAAAIPLPEGLSVDIEQSQLLAFLKPDGEKILSGLAHQHVLEAKKWQASFELDPEKPESCRGAIRLDIEGLEVDAPKARKAQGWKPISEKDRAKIRRNMLAEDQLHAKKFPTMSFDITRCRVIDLEANKYYVDAKMSLRGKTKDEGAYVTIEKDGQRLRARGELTFRHTQFGFEPYSAALGTIKNSDIIRVTFDLALTIPPALDR